MAKALQDCILLLGDSLIAMQKTERNLHASLSQAYSRKLDVLNRGFGGWNSNGTRVLLDEMLAPREQAAAPMIRLAIIWLVAICGGPDSSIHRPYYAWDLCPVDVPGPDKGRVVHARVDERIPGCCARYWYSLEDRRELAGGRWAVEEVDLLKDMEEASGEGLERFFLDGVHLSPAGYDLVWNGVSKVIKQKFTGRGLDWEDEQDLPPRIPWQEQVNWIGKNLSWRA